MVTKMKIPSAAKAKKYFQDKMSFATGPVELERWVKQGQPVNIVDVRAAEDYAEDISRPRAIYRKTNGVTPSNSKPSCARTRSTCSIAIHTCATLPQPRQLNLQRRATR